MNVLQTIISYLAIAAAFISSCFSWGDSAMIPYTNDYTIPDGIPEYTAISTEEKKRLECKVDLGQGKPYGEKRLDVF